MSDKLDLEKLYTQKKITEDIRIKAYKQILFRIHKRIKSVSRQRNNQCFCIYLMPEFILGVPKYDIAACTSFAIEKLTNNGFNIKYTYPNLLFISWKHYIPSYKRLEYKLKTGINIDGFGNIIQKKENKTNNLGKNGNNILTNYQNNKNIKLLKNKNYKDISTYKPTGNLIYNNELIKKIETNIK